MRSNKDTWKLKGSTQLSERRFMSIETKPRMRKSWLNNGGKGMLNTGMSELKICTSDTRMRTLTMSRVTRQPRRDVDIRVSLFEEVCSWCDPPLLPPFPWISCGGNAGDGGDGGGELPPGSSLPSIASPIAALFFFLSGAAALHCDDDRTS